MKLNVSPVTSHSFNGIDFYLKRDDLLHPLFSGNKARKFSSLLDLPPHTYTTLIGYGSVQANSLYSLAALAKLKGWAFEYYVDRIPSWLANEPRGNYGGAVEMGAKIIDLSGCEDRNGRHPHDYINKVRKPESDCLFIPEGGRCQLAEQGIKTLALEIMDWKSQQVPGHLTLALPSGTGTTALYLQKHLAAEEVTVITCSCVGGPEYLLEQWHSLEPSLENYPRILPHRKHHFGKLYLEDYQYWSALLEETGVEFDLLYDPLMWLTLAEWKPEGKTTLMYLHQGGLLGNQTMLPRYQRKYAEDKT
ncbi:1-aminocyclopropane-1-carboxylate deaminase/D-cysteine desulfhydrase [Veronia pacifica]|uniref:1-aminocyclopropane-1-carboxylate deaminase n=1 Tax=Veronia pacifica TaxID=1080227 RepID=A0A1C3ER81_9GAMM|nr:1-aminocyclopropane-1-carboxylate deaminase/D-cysteine desulfhydrase [Veronia pacifica]ODA35732.1 1-aminocyclopropane-1-carboxylate deaminase [Veronia pacifica]